MTESPATRHSLLVRIRDVKDAEAWAEFVRIYAPLVYNLARRQGLQDADAADLTQNVLRDVVAAAEGFVYEPGRGSFRSWLFTVARNRLRKFLHARRRGQEAGDAHDLLDQAPAPEETDEWEREYRQRLLTWAAEKVRDGFRESTWLAFWLTSVEGRDTRDVAEELGLSVGAVYIARNRVLARIRETIRQVLGE